MRNRTKEITKYGRSWNSFVRRQSSTRRGRKDGAGGVRTRAFETKTRVPVALSHGTRRRHRKRYTVYSTRDRKERRVSWLGKNTRVFFSAIPRGTTKQYDRNSNDLFMKKVLSHISESEPFPIDKISSTDRCSVRARTVKRRTVCGVYCSSR